MHIDISGHYEACQADLVRWVIYGLSCNVTEHLEEADAQQEQWRSHVQMAYD